MKQVILTKKLIEACESLAHSYTAKTLIALGADFHPGTFQPITGWKERLIGNTVTEESYQLALEGRSKHFFKEQAKKDQPTLL